MILGIVAFIFIFIIIIAAHEAGHLIAAKRAGVRVSTYSIGMGPPVYTFKKANPNDPTTTTYQLAAFPLGGYCSIAGMTNLSDDDETPASRRFDHTSLGRRIWIMSAGIVTNIILGIALIVILALSTTFPDVSADTSPTIAEVQDGSPAQAAHLNNYTSATITKVGDTDVATLRDVQQATKKYPNTQITITVTDDGGTHNIPVTPRENGTLGVTMVTAEPTARKAESVPDGLHLAATYTTDLIGRTVYSVVTLPQKAIPAFQAITGHVPRSDDSPVSIIGASRISGEVAQAQAWTSFLLMAANVSIFLGLFNLVPITPLDGGHILINCIGHIRKRKHGETDAPGIGVDYGKFTWVTLIAAGLLLAFGVLILIADIVAPISTH